MQIMIPGTEPSDAPSASQDGVEPVPPQPEEAQRASLPPNFEEVGCPSHWRGEGEAQRPRSCCTASLHTPWGRAVGVVRQHQLAAHCTLPGAGLLV